jgi:uncharacterized protein
MSIEQKAAQQQGAFAAAVLARDISAAPLQALFVGAPDHITRRLGVYRANLQAARIGALQAAFPTVQQIVGEHFFAGLARDYGRAHPSSQGNLNHFGAALADYLQGFAPAADMPYLSDMAQLDWALHRADSAADAPSLDASALSKALGTHAADSVHVQLHPAVTVLCSSYPIYDIWQYNVALREGHIALAPEGLQAQCVVVHRGEWRATATQLPQAQALALHKLKLGQTLQDALSVALETEPNIDLAQTLANWCSMGILVKVLV